jgi:hypothetical protein
LQMSNKELEEWREWAEEWIKETKCTDTEEN